MKKAIVLCALLVIGSALASAQTATPRVRKAKSDGVVTPAERAKLAREQNRANRKIYRMKHNDNVAK
jgi:membrane-bound ClpP family serine protease